MNFELSEEIQLFRDEVRDWVDQECPKAWCRELERREHQYPQELWDRLTSAGFHGIGIDEEYGGLGGDIVVQATFMRELSRNAAGLSWIWGITSFSGAKSVGLYGTEEQKRRFLPPMARGELKTAMSFTEPAGGTDLLGGMKTMARKAKGGWVISGEKIWSTTADTADYLLVIARSDPNAQRRHEGISLFLVPRASDGVSVTPLPKLGMRALSSCSVVLEDVFVPDDLLLGEPGKVWKQTTRTLNNERIMNAALCLGIIDGVLEDALDYMHQRRAFGRLIGEFQTLQGYVAAIATWQKQTELMVYNAAWLQSLDRPCAMESTMAKTLASDYACRAADRGIAILGGMGYSAETDMQRYWRD
nr:acyl-CoA dehydrogenase [Xanthomonadales bacterium]NIN59201.1 acyl-CoA dehydrogenase [Xanthomonadales bacterium]NIN74552.1 acyl-CoA dehydrogenase [Xanthomonadales bacterium]NIO13970.1 acyl-CoA dehydrogenase [Xanthomonadales bacterium]NIP11594.1 acyl-CoA dehydrogenase [Xanthomonadales bacterium]